MLINVFYTGKRLNKFFRFNKNNYRFYRSNVTDQLFEYI